MYIYIHNVLTLFAADPPLSRPERVGSPSSLCFLHHCWIPTAACPNTQCTGACFGLWHSPPPLPPPLDWFLKSLDPGNTQDLCPEH